MVDLPDLPTALALVTGGASAIRGAAEATSSIRELLKNDEKISDELRGKISNLLDQVIAAKELGVNSLDAIEVLKSELEKYRRFEDQMERYKLHQTQVGNIVWQLKNDFVKDEPLHYLCPNCVEDQRKSILQGHSEWRECPKCKAAYSFDEASIGGVVGVNYERFDKLD